MFQTLKVYGFTIFLMLLWGANTPLLMAEEETSRIPTVKELLEHKYHFLYYQGKDMSAHVHVVTTESNGSKREFEQSYIRWDRETSDDPSVDVYGDQKLYSYLYRPADYKNMVLIVWKYIGRDDDYWLYVPKIDLVKRIPPVDERTPHMGSVFCTEDTSGRDFEKDTHEFVEVTDTCYVFKSTPKEPRTVEFSYFKTWLQRKTFVPVQVEYYDKNGVPIRRWNPLNWEIKDGFVYYYKVQMKDLKANRVSVATFSNMKFNTGVTEDIFLERFMRNPPEDVFR